MVYRQILLVADTLYLYRTLAARHTLVQVMILRNKLCTHIDRSILQ